jgi:YtkA-like
MQKKIVIIGSVVVLLASVIVLLQWRSRIMGQGAQISAGGLVSVSSSGTPMPVPVSQAAKGKVPGNMAVQESEDWLVSLALSPYPPSMSTACNFEVRLADLTGQSISGASISLDLTMPGMYMPPNKLSLEPSGEGRYLAMGHFTMRGPWRMEAIITVDGKTRSVFFDVWL